MMTIARFVVAVGRSRKVRNIFKWRLVQREKLACSTERPKTRNHKRTIIVEVQEFIVQGFVSHCFSFHLGRAKGTCGLQQVSFMSLYTVLRMAKFSRDFQAWIESSRCCAQVCGDIGPKFKGIQSDEA